MTLGNRPAPEQGSWQIPGAASAYQPPDEAVRGAGRGRPGVVALVVALVELVIIAAVGNQAVSKHALRYFVDHQSTFLGRVVASALQVAWRFSPVSSDNHDGMHALYSQLVFIAVFVVLSALLAAVATRGPVTFWRAGVGIWTGVVAAICVARVVGSLVTRSNDRDLGRVTSAFFVSINNLTVFVGLVIGLIAALVAALFAVATRRAVDRPAAGVPAPAEAVHIPETPPPFYGAPRPARPAEPAPEADGRTTQIPRFDPRGGQQWSPPAGEDQPTQGFPRSDDGGSTQAMPTAPDDDRR